MTMTKPRTLLGIAFGLSLAACEARAPIVKAPTDLATAPPAPSAQTAQANLPDAPIKEPAQDPLTWYLWIDGPCTDPRMLPIDNGMILKLNPPALYHVDTEKNVLSVDFIAQRHLGLGGAWGRFPDSVWLHDEVVFTRGGPSMVGISHYDRAGATPMLFTDKDPLDPLRKLRPSDTGYPANKNNEPYLLPSYELAVMFEKGIFLAYERFYDQGAPDGKFVAFDAAGARLPNYKVPGKDMARAQSLHAFANSTELLGVSVRGGKLKLHRWSTQRPVADLEVPLKRPYRSDVSRVDYRKEDSDLAGWDMYTSILVGKSRAYVREGNNVFAYDGSTLSSVKVPAKHVGAFSWALGPNDELYISSGKVLLTFSVSGEVSEEPLPDMGRPYVDALGHRWLVASGGYKVYGWTGKTWESVVLDDPNHMKTFQLVHDKNAAYLILGSHTGSLIYSTRKPPETLRCSDVASHGKALPAAP
jgi:hypothetical protein